MGTPFSGLGWATRVLSCGDGPRRDGEHCGSHPVLPTFVLSRPLEEDCFSDNNRALLVALVLDRWAAVDTPSGCARHGHRFAALNELGTHRSLVLGIGLFLCEIP